MIDHKPSHRRLAPSPAASDVSPSQWNMQHLRIQHSCLLPHTQTLLNDFHLILCLMRVAAGRSPDLSSCSSPLSRLHFSSTFHRQIGFVALLCHSTPPASDCLLATHFPSLHGAFLPAFPTYLLVVASPQLYSKTSTNSAARGSGAKLPAFVCSASARSARVYSGRHGSQPPPAPGDKGLF